MPRKPTTMFTSTHEAVEAVLAKPRGADAVIRKTVDQFGAGAIGATVADRLCAPKTPSHHIAQLTPLMMFAEIPEPAQARLTQRIVELVTANDRNGMLPLTVLVRARADSQCWFRAETVGCEKSWNSAIGMGSDAPCRSYVRASLGHIAVALGILVCTLATGWASDHRGQRIRDTVSVRLAGGVVETWSLRWTTPPQPYCAAPVDAICCPCVGFEFAEQGAADIVRERSGVEIDRFSLDMLFHGKVKQPAFPRWSLTPSDRQALVDAPDDVPAALARRPLSHVLAVADHDGDGTAAEFVVQVDAGPCGHRDAVLVGLGPHGKLRVYGRNGDPRFPVVLAPEDWKRLLGRRTAKVMLWRCGDHGSDREETLLLRWHGRDLNVVAKSRACRKNE